MLWCNEVMISSATWTWRRSFAETVFDFIRHVAPWFYGNANRQAARSWQEGERKGAQTREWKASKEHTEIFFFFDTWLWGVRSKWRKLGQRRAKRAKGPSVIELRPPMCRSGHFLSPGPGLRWCRTWLGTVHVFMRSNEDGRERERLLWCRVPQPSSPNSFTTAQIPASSHKPPLCMDVFEIVNPYVLKWTWHKACCWSFITCVCVCMRRIQGHNIQARCISQTSRDVIL